ncbi:unnamed protein product [Owenia fusiformis]|uniref:Uncharacterized protein n=1 Tax=Owenia fusiformis TaxID=6347 RepID=A0A8S4NTE9_OWEFU|nr:unnamed protein product [Owenia fusiformis]
MGGNLFSCHSGGGRRANKMHNGNRLSREDLNFIYQYSGSTPISPSLSGGAPVSPLRNNGHNQKIPVPMLTSTPVIQPENGTAIKLAEGPLCVDISPAGYTTTTSHSKISLNENIYDKVQPSSAPSSPTVRRKAPPKPPRMRSVIQVDDDNKGPVLKVDDHLYVNISELSPSHSLRSSMPPLSPQTPVRSSMEDITSMFSENDSV